MSHTKTFFLSLLIALLLSVLVIIKLVGEKFDSASSIELIERENEIFLSTLKYSCVKVETFILSAKESNWEYELHQSMDKIPIPVGLRREEISGVLAVWVSGRTGDKFEDVYLYFGKNGCLIGV